MTVSLYKVSVPIFVQFLTSLSAVLDKAAAFCEAKKVEPAALLNMRLAPDMYTLVRQVRSATDHAINGTARLAGVDPMPSPIPRRPSPKLKARIAKSIDFVKGFTPAQIDGTEDKDISWTRWRAARCRLHRAGATARHFACRTSSSTAPPPTTSLRHNGVEIGKRDYHGYAGQSLERCLHPDRETSVSISIVTMSRRRSGRLSCRSSAASPNWCCDRPVETIQDGMSAIVATTLRVS